MPRPAVWPRLRVLLPPAYDGSPAPTVGDVSHSHEQDGNRLLCPVPSCRGGCLPSTTYLLSSTAYRPSPAACSPSLACVMRTIFSVTAARIRGSPSGRFGWPLSRLYVQRIRTSCDARIRVKPASVVCIRGNIGPHTEFHDGISSPAQPESNGYKHCR
jgi:hypothetical protein